MSTSKPKVKENYKSIAFYCAAAIKFETLVSQFLPGRLCKTATESISVTAPNQYKKRNNELNHFSTVKYLSLQCLAITFNLIFCPCVTLKTTWPLGCRLLFRKIYGAIVLRRKDLGRWLTRQRLLAVSAIITLTYSSLLSWVGSAWWV